MSVPFEAWSQTVYKHMPNHHHSAPQSPLMPPPTCYPFSYFPEVATTLNPMTSMSSACLCSLYDGIHALGVPLARLLWVELVSVRLIYNTACSINSRISSHDVPVMKIPQSACSAVNGYRFSFSSFLAVTNEASTSICMYAF